MRKKAAAIFYTTITILAFLWIFSPSVAQSPPTEIGRYQMATDFKQDGFNQIYVTVIDTTTGEVVRREEYDPGNYDKGVVPR